MARLHSSLRVSSAERLIARFVVETEIPVIETSPWVVQEITGGKVNVCGVFFSEPRVIRVREFKSADSVGDYYAVVFHEIGHAALVLDGLAGRPAWKMKGGDEELVVDHFSLALMDRLGLVVPEWFREAVGVQVQEMRSSSRSGRAEKAGRDLADAVWEWLGDE